MGNELKILLSDRYERQSILEARRNGEFNKWWAQIIAIGNRNQEQSLISR